MTRSETLAWLLAAYTRANLPVPESLIGEALALPVPPEGGYTPPQAGGSFEHTTMLECPDHPGQVVFWKKYKDLNPAWRCVLCTLGEYARSE